MSRLVDRPMSSADQCTHSISAEDFSVKNMALLRNTSFANFFDLCSISLPLPRGSGQSTSLLLSAQNGRDRDLFKVAAAIEQLLPSW